MKGLPTLGLLHREAKLQLCVARNAKLQLCWPSSSSLFLKTSLFSTFFNFFVKNRTKLKKEEKSCKKMQLCVFREKKRVWKNIFSCEKLNFFHEKIVFRPSFLLEKRKVASFYKKVAKSVPREAFCDFQTSPGSDKI